MRPSTAFPQNVSSRELSVPSLTKDQELRVSSRSSRGDQAIPNYNPQLFTIKSFNNRQKKVQYAKKRQSRQTSPSPKLFQVPVFKRTNDEKREHGERLNLDRKNLNVCPLLEGEEGLKLLNYQNNQIREISNLSNLSHLIFLDLYNNQLTRISNLESVPTLRVLMLGRNNITEIRGLDKLKRLDVLDLHSNKISKIENLDHLSELRVLNLAGNDITTVERLKGLGSLTEINLRRNKITHVFEVHLLPELQRVFLSSNKIRSFTHISNVFQSVSLFELSLDGNPVNKSQVYRSYIVAKLRSLRILDLQPVSDDERQQATAIMSSLETDTAKPTAFLSARSIGIRADVTPKGIRREIPTSFETEYSTEKKPELTHGDAAPTKNYGRYIDPLSFESRREKKEEITDETQAFADDDNASIFSGSKAGRQSTKQGVSIPVALESPKAESDLEIDLEEEETEDIVYKSLPSKRPPMFIVDSKTLTLSGERTEWEPGHYVIESVSLLDVSSKRIATHIIPKLQEYPIIDSIHLDNNGIVSVEDLMPFSKLESLRIVRITDNPVVEEQQRLLKPFLISTFPELAEVNGERITQEDRLVAAGLFVGVRKYHKLLGVGFIKNKSFITEAHHNQEAFCTNYVHSVMEHAMGIEAKIKILNAAWDKVVEDIVYKTLVQLGNPSFIDEYLENI